ncbi:MAG: bifunctional adenosylcobinamide kinase/adenosylcobinamide-phosphate guanylyltransferase [Bacillota bacterium]|nr:bifunctional adenosylcobinamide kinase/adenosylcobinamide-phosphate guanylyltransferase [Bacillota bacterium]
MSEVILVTGGARSGKSNFAEKICKTEEGKVLYLATSVPFDEEMKDRIKKHKEDRPDDWLLIEKYKDFKELEEFENFKKSDIVLLDCITVMISNVFVEEELDDNTEILEYDKIEKKIIEDIDELITLIKNQGKIAVLVSNEIGMGIVPINRFTRMYRDTAGRVNQYISDRSDKVYLTVSGIGIDIKSLEEKFDER